MPDNKPRPGEIYIEIKQLGNTVRVAAVDAESGEEAVIIGPASAAHADLQRVAVRKLKMKLGQGKN